MLPFFRLILSAFISKRQSEARSEEKKSFNEHDSAKVFFSVFHFIYSCSRVDGGKFRILLDWTSVRHKAPLRDWLKTVFIVQHETKHASLTRWRVAVRVESLIDGSWNATMSHRNLSRVCYSKISLPSSITYY